jgi:two-component system chemotaxis response regulator CheY
MPSAILIDGQMPVMTGLEFTRRLRTEPGGDGPRVVFCSEETDLERIREALDAGADEYIMKPFDGEIVASKLACAGVMA